MPLLLGVVALPLSGTQRPVVAQMDTLDLSGDPVATVVPAEYDGGFFARIGDIVVNDLGVWVGDTGNNEVLWFDTGGNLLSRYGREGSGPGEWLSPGIVSIDSILTVGDARQGRYVRYRLDGRERFRLRDVSGDLLYGVARDELDVPSVGAMGNPVGVTLVPEAA